MFEKFYNLSGLPFLLTPDSRFFFGSSGHSRAIAHLVYGLSQEEGFIVITGEVGAGKTTLTEQLWSQLDRNTYVIARIVTTLVSGDDLLRLAMAQFGVGETPGTEKATLLRRFEHMVRDQRRQGKRCLLVVDEVQNLPLAAMEELRMLSNITVEGKASLQTILLGQPQFRPILASNDWEQLRQRVLASYHLGPLDEPETRGYIEHRLRTVGWRNDPAWQDAAFQAVHRHTGGIPRRINTLCSRILLFGALEEAHTITGAMVDNTAEELNRDLGAGQFAPSGSSPSSLARPTIEDDAEMVRRIETLERQAFRQEQMSKRMMDLFSGQRHGRGMTQLRNAMTVDVEDYFQVQAFAHCVDRKDWDTFPSRVERNTNRVLDQFAAAEVHATFFTLGWVAERFPTLIRRIVDEGHELASHGWDHTRVDAQEPEMFRADIRRTRSLLEQTGGVAVAGYRAATFSIGARTMWAFPILRQEGYTYSSSINPIRHDLYGMPDAPRVPFRPDPAGVMEIPMTTVRLLGRNWPCSGGGYFRLLPPALYRAGLARVNEHDRQPGIFYFHPWEIDPGQPRIADAGWKSRIRHYTNLSRMTVELDKLLRDFQWGRMDRVYGPILSDAIAVPGAVPGAVPVTV